MSEGEPNENELRDMIDTLLDAKAALEADRLALLVHAEQLEKAAGVHGGCIRVSFNEASGVIEYSVNGSSNRFVPDKDDESVALHAYVESLAVGYDEHDGVLFKRFRPGRAFYWLTVGESIRFVTSQRPERTDVNGVVTYTWAAVATEGGQQ